MAPRHSDDSIFVPAPPEQVFAFVDDHSRLASHMNQSSWMMGGGRMLVEVDEAKGQAVGSHIRLEGTVFGFRVFLDEVVTRRDPPLLKVWETVGIPRLLVIGKYSMGVRVTPIGRGSQLQVFIDYELPTRRATYWLGRLFGRMYAKWCVTQMLKGALRQFSADAVEAA